MEIHREFKKIRFYVKIFTGIILSFILIGCAAILMGSGKSAVAEDTGFFSRYDDLKSESDPAFVGLPDLYSIRSGVNWGAYKKIILPDFTSLAVNVRDLYGMQLTDYKTIKKDLPDQIAQALALQRRLRWITLDISPAIFLYGTSGIFLCSASAS